ncbi:MAG: hypothetical protein COC10_05135 [Sphingobium sp.]|nr:MAG: hypothetical protein COC10_05135 [Sphingobium sp.]
MDWKIQQPGGDPLRQWRSKLSNRLTIAAARATDKASQLARDDVRNSMRSQRLGGLSRTIAATSDAKKGRVRSGDIQDLDVGGFVTVRGVKSQRAAGALRSYVDQDATNISPVRGRWLAIATKEIPQRASRRKMTPELYKSSGLEERIGPLQFVKGRPGVAYLVVKDATVPLNGKGRARRVPKNGNVRAGRARVGFVAFILIRVTRRSRRTDPRRIAERWAQRLPALLAEQLSAGGNSNS